MTILPTKSEILWESADAQKLREFLETPTGNKILQHLSDSVPSLLDGADVNRTLVRSGEVKGAQLILSSLILLTVEQPLPTKQQETYPSLDDESAWEGEHPKSKT